MRAYKSVNKLIKAYIFQRYTEPDLKNEGNEEVDAECYDFMNDFLKVLKKYDIIKEYKLEVHDEHIYKSKNLTSMGLYYKLPNEADDKIYYMGLLF